MKLTNRMVLAKIAGESLEYEKEIRQILADEPLRQSQVLIGVERMDHSVVHDIARASFPYCLNVFKKKEKGRRKTYEIIFEDKDKRKEMEILKIGKGEFAICYKTD